MIKSTEVSDLNHSATGAAIIVIIIIVIIIIIINIIIIQSVHLAYSFHEDFPMTIIKFMLIKVEQLSNNHLIVNKQYAQSTGYLHHW